MKALLLRHKKKKQDKDKKGKSSSNEGKSEAMESSKMVSSVKQQVAG